MDVRDVRAAVRESAPARLFESWQMRVAVRGWGDGRLLFEEIVEESEDDDTADLRAIAQKHVERVAAYAKNMIEIEFLDYAPDPNRFFRFGTDTRGMVLPRRIR